MKSQSISLAAIVAVSLLVFSSATMAATAQGGEAPRFETTTIDYGDLNLHSRQGTKVLYARLRNGAEDVCSSFEGRDLFFKKLWQSCFEQAVTAAVAQVNSPGLTDLHNQTVNRSRSDR